MRTIGKTRQPADRAPRGVLHRLAVGRFAHERAAPPPDLIDWVEHFWQVWWNLDGLPPQLQETLPHPNVHIVVEPGTAAAWGVHTGRWTRLLEGRSIAFGIKFRAGAFRPWLSDAVSTLTNGSMPAASLFGGDAARLHELVDCDRFADACERAAQFLRERLPAVDARALLAGRIVDSAVHDRELHAAGELARRFGMSLRALQRLFSDYVGASPKWVINRYRIHEAIARVQAGQPASWATLAQDLGYFDQAHFIADFRRLVGRTPADYAKDTKDAKDAKVSRRARKKT